MAARISSKLARDTLRLTLGSIA